MHYLRTHVSFSITFQNPFPHHGLNITREDWEQRQTYDNRLPLMKQLVIIMLTHLGTPLIRAKYMIV